MARFHLLVCAMHFIQCKNVIHVGPETSVFYESADVVQLRCVRFDKRKGKLNVAWSEILRVKHIDN